MSEGRGRTLLGGLALVSCPLLCLGLPLVVAAGISAGLALTVGGAIVSGVALPALGVAVFVSVRRRRSTEACRAPRVHRNAARTREGAPPPKRSPAQVGKP
jgi:hypothetical protein